MRAVVQRVTQAAVSVDGLIVGKINRGYLVLLGIGHGDDEASCEKLAEKIVNLRIFEDENGKINLSLNEVDGEILVVSQFTLYADCKKRRPGFIDAASPETAQRLYERFAEICAGMTKNVERGVFGAHMSVELVNDGPFTICLEV